MAGEKALWEQIWIVAPLSLPGCQGTMVRLLNAQQGLANNCSRDRGVSSNIGRAMSCLSTSKSIDSHFFEPVPPEFWSASNGKKVNHPFRQ